MTQNDLGWLETKLNYSKWLRMTQNSYGNYYWWLNMTLDESSLHLQVLSKVRRILISRYTVARWHLRERPPHCVPMGNFALPTMSLANVNNFSMQIDISISNCRPCSNSTICTTGAALTAGAHDATTVQDIFPGQVVSSERLADETHY